MWQRVSAVQLFSELGARAFFALLRSRAQEHDEKRAPKSESAERQKSANSLCPFLAIMSWLSWLSCSSCPVPWLSCLGCPVLGVLL
jgi:hypothetical protein